MGAPVLAAAGLSLALFLSGFLSLLTPLPLGVTAVRKGPAVALAALGVATAVLVGLYRWGLPFLPVKSMALGLIYYGYYAAIGLALAHVGRRLRSLEASLAIILLSVLAFLGLALFGFSRATGTDLITAFREGLQRSLEQMVSLKEQAGLGGDPMLVVKQSAPAIAARVTSLLPGIAVAGTFLVTALNLTFLRRWGGDASLFARAPEFAAWRLPEYVIWIPIGAGVAYFVNLYGIRNAVVGTVLWNLFIGLLVLYLTQGLAIVSFFFRKRLSPFLRMVSYLVLILFFQAVGIFIVILGLFDFWFDFRKLRKVT